MPKTTNNQTIKQPGPNVGTFLIKNTPLTMQMLRDWWNSAEPGEPCFRYLDWHPREQLSFWHCIMESPKYERHVKLINYKHIGGGDGPYIRVGCCSCFYFLFFSFCAMHNANVVANEIKNNLST